MTIYASIVGFSWMVFIAIWVISAFRAKRNVGKTWWGIGIRIFPVFIFIALFESKTFSFDTQFSTYSPSPLVGSIGGLLTILGIAFAIWARVNIGKNWGMPMSIKEEPELVTSGPYEYVRHPIYTGILTAMAGTTLAVGAWGLAPLIFSAIYFLYSAIQEEKLLMQKFPNQYPEYKKRTKMLIPFIF